MSLFTRSLGKDVSMEVSSLKSVPFLVRDITTVSSSFFWRQLEIGRCGDRASVRLELRIHGWSPFLMAITISRSRRHSISPVS